MISVAKDDKVSPFSTKFLLPLHCKSSLEVSL